MFSTQHINRPLRSPYVSSKFLNLPSFLLSHPSNVYHPLNFLKLPPHTLTFLHTHYFLHETSYHIFNQHTILPFSTPSTSHRNPSHTPEFLPSMCCIYFRFVSSSCCRIFIFSVIPRRICSRRG